jgi:hypothetical protein
MADFEIKQYKLMRLLYSFQAKYLQGPFDILAIVPVDCLSGDIFIKGMATQLPT